MPTFWSLVLGLVLLALLNLTRAHGDRLNRTFCLCGADNHFDADAPLEDVSGPASTGLQASYFLFEYHNFHLDHTFVMDETCRSDITGTNSPIAHFINPTPCLDYVGVRPKLCKQFPPLPHEAATGPHEFCYHFQGLGRIHPRDSYSWDGQNRGVPDTYAMFVEYQDRVTAVCAPICREKFALPLFIGAQWYWKSAQSMVYDQADMCHGCA